MFCQVPFLPWTSWFGQGKKSYVCSSPTCISPHVLGRSRVDVIQEQFENSNIVHHLLSRFFHFCVSWTYEENSEGSVQTWDELLFKLIYGSFIQFTICETQMSQWATIVFAFLIPDHLLMWFWVIIIIHGLRFTACIVYMHAKCTLYNYIYILMCLSYFTSQSGGTYDVWIC